MSKPAQALIAAAAALAAPAAAKADPGAHVHPHGAEGWLVATVVLAFCAVLAAAVLRRIHAARRAGRS